MPSLSTTSMKQLFLGDGDRHLCLHGQSLKSSHSVLPSLPGEIPSRDIVTPRFRARDVVIAEIVPEHIFEVPHAPSVCPAYLVVFDTWLPICISRLASCEFESWLVWLGAYWNGMVAVRLVPSFNAPR